MDPAAQSRTHHRDRGQRGILNRSHILDLLTDILHLLTDIPRATLHGHTIATPT